MVFHGAGTPEATKHARVGRSVARRFAPILLRIRRTEWLLITTDTCMKKKGKTITAVPTGLLCLIDRVPGVKTPG